MIWEFYGLKMDQYKESQNKAYHIFSEAKTQIVAPAPTRSSFNWDNEKWDGPHQIRLLKSFISIYWISF